MPTVLKQTTKQAKAAFKARGRPSLTEKEQRQLERSIELENRADRIKEAERRRAEATKKRLERESKEKLGQGNSAQLGSQRRCDRFGYKSSQFHLGAFFGRQPAAAKSHKNSNMSAVNVVDDDAFGDDDLDDDSLLEALHEPVTPQPENIAHKTIATLESSAALMPPPPLPMKPQARQMKSAVVSQDMASFLEELESSTQIARELDDSHESDVVLERSPDIRSGSFSSGSLDLTVEDLEALDQPKLAMPPPPVPKAKSASIMPPPAMPAKRQYASFARAPPSAASRKVQNAVTQPQPSPIRGPFLPASSLYCSPDLGFTNTQLEHFIDDDIQLTQMAT